MTRRALIFISCLIAGLSIVALVGWWQVQVLSHDEWNDFSDATLGLSFSHPPAWEFERLDLPREGLSRNVIGIHSQSAVLLVIAEALQDTDLSVPDWFERHGKVQAGLIEGEGDDPIVTDNIQQKEIIIGGQPAILQSSTVTPRNPDETQQPQINTEIFLGKPGKIMIVRLIEVPGTLELDREMFDRFIDSIIIQ